MNQQDQNPTLDLLLNDYNELKDKGKLKQEKGEGPTGEPIAVIKMEMPKDTLGRATPPHIFSFNKGGVASLISRQAFEIHQAEMEVIQAQERLDNLRRRSQLLQLEALMTDVEACLKGELTATD